MAKGDEINKPQLASNLGNYGLNQGTNYVANKIGGRTGQVVGEGLNQLGQRYIPGIAGPIGGPSMDVANVANKAGGGGISPGAIGGGLAGMGLDYASRYIPEGHGKVQGAISGAGKGMQYGSMFGPMGTLAGAGIGALVGTIKGHQNQTLPQREKFAQQLGYGNGKELDPLFAALSAAGRDDLVESARNKIGKSDFTDNEKWMQEVAGILGGGQGNSLGGPAQPRAPQQPIMRPDGSRDFSNWNPINISPNPYANFGGGMMPPMMGGNIPQNAGLLMQQSNMGNGIFGTPQMSPQVESTRMELPQQQVPNMPEPMLNKPVNRTPFMRNA